MDVSGWLSEHAGLLQRAGWIWFGIGIGSFVLTLIALPLVVVRLPDDYFVRLRRERVSPHLAHRMMAMTGVILKNALGILLIVVGAVMLFIPGQGILTMLIGLVLTNFPGKYRLERRLVRRPAVMRTLNRVRRAAGRPPLLPPPEPDPEED